MKWDRDRAIMALILGVLIYYISTTLFRMLLKVLAVFAAVYIINRLLKKK